MSQIDGIDEGYYPPWLHAEMDRCMPRETRAKYGSFETSFVSGGFTIFEKDQLENIIAEL